MNTYERPDAEDRQPARAVRHSRASERLQTPPGLRSLGDRESRPEFRFRTPWRMMVEAGGIEPPSEESRVAVTTRLVRGLELAWRTPTDGLPLSQPIEISGGGAIGEPPLPSPLNDVPVRCHGRTAAERWPAVRPPERNRCCLRVNFAVRLSYGPAVPGVRPRPSSLRRTRFAPTSLSVCGCRKIGENDYA